VLIFASPGQGAQSPGFLSPWLELPGIADQLGAWSELAGRDLIRLGTTGSAEEITDTAVAQPLLVAAALAVAGLLGEPDAAAGHSVGELAAGAIAGVLSAADAMRLTRVRGEAMAAACGYRGVAQGGDGGTGSPSQGGSGGMGLPGGSSGGIPGGRPPGEIEPTGMTAVLGGDEAAVLAAIAEAGLTPANVNGAGQIVAGGTLEQLAEFAANPPAGARLRPLRVAGAFHTKHMAPAVDALERAAAQTMVKDPAITLLSNADGKVVTSGATWVERIVNQVANPVRWDMCMETMSDIGVTAMIELLPGGTLTGMAKRALPGVELLAIKTPDQLATARELVGAHATATNGYQAASVGSPAEWKIVVAPGGGTFRSGAEEEAAVATSAGGCVSAGAVLGRVVARGGERPVTAQFDAVLVEWLAEDGDPVSEGQPLVRLQPSEP
jgi:[acyl-carrier-protein] S-malonyltransferase